MSEKNIYESIKEDFKKIIIVILVICLISLLLLMILFNYLFSFILNLIIPLFLLWVIIGFHGMFICHYYFWNEHGLGKDITNWPGYGYYNTLYRRMWGGLFRFQTPKRYISTDFLKISNIQIPFISPILLVKLFISWYNNSEDSLRDLWKTFLFRYQLNDFDETFNIAKIRHLERKYSQADSLYGHAIELSENNEKLTNVIYANVNMLRDAINDLSPNPFFKLPGSINYARRAKRLENWANNIIKYESQEKRRKDKINQFTENYCNKDNELIIKTIIIDLQNLPETAYPLELILIPKGSFVMGSSTDDNALEIPQRVVTITRDYYLSKYTITKAQWNAIMRVNINKDLDKIDIPMTECTLSMCQKLIYNLNKLGYGKFRLPSEAEWEYACRAGTNTRFYWGNDEKYSEINNYAWYRDNSSYKVNQVGLKLPNNFGLYDMSGNVHEICSDRFHKNYVDAPEDEKSWSTFPNDWLSFCFNLLGNYICMMHGGSIFSKANDIRSSSRKISTPFDRLFTKIIRCIQKKNIEFPVGCRILLEKDK